MERLICIIIGYAFGLIQTSYLYGKFKHIDIRDHGSGNAGTTNALRTLGWKAGAITFLGDCFKCVFAVILVRLIYQGCASAELPLLSMYAGIGAVLGHNYPFYLGFKGGKGIAATAGLIISTSLWMAGIEFVLFIALVGLTRYVSVGSLAVVIAFTLEVVIFGQMGGFRMEQDLLYEMYIITILLLVSAFFRHRENIKRLLNGTENKLGTKKE